MQSLYGLAHVLKIEPLELFLEASPPTTPEWLLKQLGIESDLANLATATLPTPQRMLEIVEVALRTELERVREPFQA